MMVQLSDGTAITVDVSDALFITSGGSSSSLSSWRPGTGWNSTVSMRGPALPPRWSSSCKTRNMHKFGARMQPCRAPTLDFLAVYA